MAITITGNATDRWQFSVDRGGTFTDVIGIDPDGRLHTAKLLSDSPAYPHAAIEGIRRLLDLPLDAPIPEDRVAALGMSFTQAYAAAPVCSPYRASLMTGQYPARVGITDYLRPDSPIHLPTGLVTVSGPLQSATVRRSAGHTPGDPV